MNMAEQYPENTPPSLKTLKAIRQFIALEDKESLVLIAGRLQKESPGQGSRLIAEALEKGHFSDALELIGTLEGALIKPALRPDPEIGQLKVAYHYLLQQLSIAQEQRAEAARAVDSFQARYQAQTSEYIFRALFLSKEKLRLQAEEHPELQETADKAAEDYENYATVFNLKSEDLQFVLSEPDIAKLKKLYRQACLLCHPDRVKAEQRERAQEIFEELTKAYTRNDLPRVSAIANLLSQSPEFDFALDTVQDAEALRQLIERTRQQLRDTEEEHQAITRSSTYQLLKSLDFEWEDYLKLMAKNLKARVAELEKWHLTHYQRIPNPEIS